MPAENQHRSGEKKDRPRTERAAQRSSRRASSEAGDFWLEYQRFQAGTSYS
jgi:hypothetical protein